MAGTAYRDLVVRIVGDAKQMTAASKEAETGIAGFENRLGKVQSALAAAFAGGALVAFAKVSTQAALEDSRAQERLAKTLENVVGANDAVKASVEKSIAGLERQYAVADDELRPAFETLVRATKDVGQAQSLMQLALDVSAGSGRSLQDVSLALVKAQNGQMRALKDLGIQVKTTSGDTADFADVQGQLNQMFGGQAAEAANSQTGRLKAMQISYENLKESVGRALLPVMMQLADIANSLLGWFNDLDEGTQRFIVQVVGLGVAGFTAVKAFVAIREAITLMNLSMSTSPVGAFVAALATLGTMLFLSSRNADDAQKPLNDYSDAVKQLGLDADSTNQLLNAFVQMTHDDFKPDTKSVDTFTRSLKALGLGAKDSGLLLKWFTTPGMKMSDIFDQLTPAGQMAARSLKAFSTYAQDLPPAVEGGTKSIDEQRVALEKLELPLNSSQQSMHEWVLRQQYAAEKSEEWAKRTIAAYDQVFRHLQGLIDNDRLLDALAEKQKAYGDAVEKSGVKSSAAMRANRELVLAVAEAAQGAAAAVPGFDKLTEAQQRASQSEFIINWARNVQSTTQKGSPLWIALQALIDQFATLYGLQSSTMDMVGSIQLPDSILKRIGKRAAGGPVDAGSTYLVGEKGPELFVPGQSGTIVPNGAGGGSVSVTINTVAGDLLAIERIVLDAIGRANRRGMTALVP